MDAIARIELFNNLFYVFAGTAVLSLILAVVFFIKFDIPGIYAIMTGKQRKRTIRQMQERSQETGKLRYEYPTGGTTGKRSRTERTGTNPAARVTPPPAPAPARQQRPQQPPVPASVERPETEVLTQAARETEVLKVESAQTELLRQTPISSGNTEELDQTMILKPAHLEFMFHTTERTIEIHTEELI